MALVVALWAWFAAVAPAAADGVFILVRHAEKVDDSEDSELSDAGKLRARALAAMLSDVDIESIYATDLIRTRETARPLAERLGIDVTLYDPNALEQLAHELLEGGGRSLVVGHSNTTPELVELLGGEPHGPIEEDEYDRIYIVVVSDDDVVTTLIRYAPWQ